MYTTVCTLALLTIIQSDFTTSLQSLAFAVLLFLIGYFMVHSSYSFLYEIDEKGASVLAVILNYFQEQAYFLFLMSFILIATFVLYRTMEDTANGKHDHWFKDKREKSSSN